MTAELYRIDPYRTDFVAMITDRSDDEVILDQTCLSPAIERVSIGDTGWLGQHPVIGVDRAAGGRLVHRLATGGTAPDLEPGAPVVGRVDWTRRYLGMRVHTAYHLVDLALRATHGVVGIVVQSIDELVFTLGVVLDGGRLDSGAVREWVTSVVREDLPMAVSPPSDLFGGPMWHLDGLGHRRCAALHVSSTGEVGAINVALVESESAQVRLRVEIGRTGGARGGNRPDVLHLRHRSLGDPI